MSDNFIPSLKKEFEEAVDHLKGELARIHTGRASVSLIEDLGVDYYDSRTPLKSLASISVTAPREIKVEVWDQNAVKAVSDALAKASLGAFPQVEGQVIHISLPPVTGESREKMVKRVHDLLEKTRISLRNSREKLWDKLQSLEQEGKIREDEKFRLKDKIQELIDEYNKKVDDLGEGKEKEIKS